jgi:hypothetical protein
MTRRAPRTDGNQSAIVAVLRTLPGCTVASLAGCADGIPDLLVGYRGRNYLFEVKDPAKPPSGRRLTPAQVEWHTHWKGSVVIVHTAQDVFDLLIGGKS